MSRRAPFWPDYGLPIVVCLSLISVLNFLWSHLNFGWYTDIPEAIAVYMVSSLAALSFLARDFRTQTLSARDLGLAPGGWKPQHRFLWFVATVSLVAFLITSSPALQKLEFGDYCFWFAFLLQASLSEILVFVSLAFCLPERWLRERGFGAGAAALLAAVPASVAFGLFHYTHPPVWQEYVFILMPEMFVCIGLFALTRNFHLTFLFHNAWAAVGFTYTQYAETPPPVWSDPQTYLDKPVWIVLFIVAFVVPYFLLHVLEWLHWSRPAEQRQAEAADPAHLAVQDG